MEPPYPASIALSRGARGEGRWTPQKGGFLLSKPTYGGQAVIEGVMMKGPRRMAIACRKPDGEITIDQHETIPLRERYPIVGWPLIRGVVSFFESLILGMQTLTFSANIFAGEDEQLTDMQMILLMATSLAMGIGLFFLAPTVLMRWVRTQAMSSLGRNLVEGFIRILFFLAYVTAISLMKDVRRVFEYHGAEHKTIHCYEAGRELTVANVKGYTTLHPRCGTNFLLIVMIVGSVFFSFFGWPSIWMRLVYRLTLLPVVAGFSYEVLRILGSGKLPWLNALTVPGLYLQKLTTREPDDQQIEVAIAALCAAIGKEGK